MSSFEPFHFTYRLQFSFFGIGIFLSWRKRSESWSCHRKSLLTWSFHIDLFEPVLSSIFNYGLSSSKQWRFSGQRDSWAFVILAAFLPQRPCMFTSMISSWSHHDLITSWSLVNQPTVSLILDLFEVFDFIGVRSGFRRVLLIFSARRDVHTCTLSSYARLTVQHGRYSSIRQRTLLD